MSLPQPIRSPAEALRFQKGLKALMSWYSHPYTHTLLLTTQLPTGGAYKSLRPYAERGWCETERRVSGVSKCTHCLWDLAGFAPERLVGLEGMHAFDELRSQLRGGRSPPLAPDRFAALVRHKVDAGELVFTAEADVEVVLQMYATGFVRVFDAYRRFECFLGDSNPQCPPAQVCIAEGVRRSRISCARLGAARKVFLQHSLGRVGARPRRNK